MAPTSGLGLIVKAYRIHELKSMCKCDALLMACAMYCRITLRSNFVFALSGGSASNFG